MTSCANVRQALLEADLASFRESEWGSHLRTCESCADLLQRLVAQQEALAVALGDLAAHVAPEIDVGRARAGAARPAGRKGVRWRVLVPLAAAALGALTLFSSERRSTRSFQAVPDWTMPVANLRSAQPVVQTSSHELVTILPTENPDITVVWFTN